MKVKWLLEKDTFEENLEPIKEAILSLGMEYKIFNYIPFKQYTPEDFYKFYNSQDCVLVYGSLNLSKVVEKRTAWTPGIWCNRETLTCSNYYPKVDKFLLNSRYTMIPYGEMKRQKNFISNVFAYDGSTIFVRPDSPFKLFSGQLISVAEYEKDVDKLGFYDEVKDSSLVIVSSPKSLLEEWRLVVVESKVVAASQYKERDLVRLKEGCPQEVIDYANEIISIWEPDQAYVMDICRNEYDKKLKLIEYNSFSSSGWYVADKMAIVKAASELAWQQWKDLNVY